MMHDELERREKANRHLIEALGNLSRETQASPGFVSRTMAEADHRVNPGQAGFNWAGISGLSIPVGLRIAVMALLVLAVTGAVPQYLNWIQAYTLGVPAETVYEARMQERLWKKNFACATQLHRDSRNYAAITGEHVVMVAWACPSGDVLVTIESTVDEMSQRIVWIPLNSGASQSSRLLGWLAQAAFADAPLDSARQRAVPMVTVLCQKWLPNHLIVRRIQLANGRCFDEVINPRTGQVKQRRRAPCDRNC